MLTFYLSLIEDVNDKYAFEDLYLSMEQKVVNYADSFVHNKNDAEDIAQEAWLCVAKNISDFRANHYESVRFYVFTVVRYRAMDFFRNATPEECTEDMDAFCNESSGDSTLLELCAKSTLEEIKNCIYLLPEIYKDVLNLYFLNDNTAKEIADMLNLKPATVRQRLHRGREMLISLLKERGIK